MAAAGLMTLLTACSALRVTRCLWVLSSCFGWGGRFGCVTDVLLISACAGSLLPKSLLLWLFVKSSLGDCRGSDSWLSTLSPEGAFDIVDWNELQPDTTRPNASNKPSFEEDVLSRLSGCCLFLTLSTFYNG